MVSTVSSRRHVEGGGCFGFWASEGDADASINVNETAETQTLTNLGKLV